MFFVRVFAHGGGSCSPRKIKLVGGSAIRVIIKMSRGHDRWTGGNRDGKLLFFVPLFVFGELSSNGSATQKQSPPCR